jgi:predicted lactoylglutathione lyase
MAHVADVDASIRFYALLGFVTDNRLESDDGRASCRRSGQLLIGQLE